MSLHHRSAIGSVNMHWCGETHRAEYSGASHVGNQGVEKFVERLSLRRKRDVASDRPRQSIKMPRDWRIANASHDGEAAGASQSTLRSLHTK